MSQLLLPHFALSDDDVPFVQEAVRHFAIDNPHVYFVFMNTRVFVNGLKNVLFLRGSPDAQHRSNFVGICNAMVHGRSDGETFGLAVAEFSIFNKPVITTLHGDVAHVNILQGNCLIAQTAQEYMQRMAELVAGRTVVKKCDQYLEFSTEAIRNKFQHLLAKAVQNHRQAA